jgi:hypothetical protein
VETDDKKLRMAENKELYERSYTEINNALRAINQAEKYMSKIFRGCRDTLNYAHAYGALQLTLAMLNELKRVYYIQILYKTHRPEGGHEPDDKEAN